MKRFLALVALLACTPPAAASTAGVPVLMYHAVNDGKPHSRIGLALTVSSKAFDEQLRYLERRRIPTLTAGELVDALGHGRHPRGVVLTFDDGYADAAAVIVPLLIRHHARATFFINSGSVGSPNHVSWAQLREMRRAGMEIGAHGAHHLDLSSLDRAGQMREAGLCVEKIQRYVGARPVTYAYASGKFNATTFEVMRALGIRSAWTELYGSVHDLRQPYKMPRYRILRDDGLASFEAVTGS